jgi:MFS family permease
MRREIANAMQCTFDEVNYQANITFAFIFYKAAWIFTSIFKPQSQSQKMQDQLHRSKYYLTNALNWCVLGIYTVSFSWLVLFKTNDPASVGLFYLLASLSSLAITPFIGPFLEKISHLRTVIFTTVLIRSFALMLPFIFTLSTSIDNYGATLVFLAAIFFGFSNTLFGSATDALMLRWWSGDDRANIAKRTGLVRQVGLASGFGGAGMSISLIGTENTLVIATVLSLLSASICLSSNVNEFITSSTEKIETQSYFSKLANGLVFIQTTPAIFLPCIITALGFSVSQISNALLAPIISSQLKNSLDFGYISSAWAFGAIASAILINTSLINFAFHFNRFYALLALGLLSISFAMSESTLMQVIIFCGMGAVFSFLRIASASDIARNTPVGKIGQVQTTLSNFISLIALVVYVIPTFSKNSPPILTFTLWGVGIVCVSLVAVFFMPHSIRLQNK